MPWNNVRTAWAQIAEEDERGGAVSNELVWMSEAAKAIAKISTPIEAKTIADKAAAIKQYAVRQNWSIEQRAEIAMIEINAVVRLGELLKQIPKQSGSRGVGKSGVTSGNPTLSDIGITKKLSHRA